ncbi:DUF5710 domain-containing protein [Caballeronia glebae]|uniref:DUF5710 domain-containing protein n=1 Tax=Caballeronia glebae TaxID=1777143 RepID=UPI001F30F0A1
MSSPSSSEGTTSLSQSRRRDGPERRPFATNSAPLRGSPRASVQHAPVEYVRVGGKIRNLGAGAQIRNTLDSNRILVTTYLDVPFREKDEAKALGARWGPKSAQVVCA